ncbi:MAG: hypothetical protein EZS28_042410, partial [Streblomastix strix]
MATNHHDQIVTIGDLDKEKCRWILQLNLGWDDLGDSDSLIEKIGQIATSLEDFRDRYIYPERKLLLFQRITQTGISWVLSDWLSKQIFEKCKQKLIEWGNLHADKNEYDKKSKYDQLRPLLYFRHSQAPRPSTENSR